MTVDDLVEGKTYRFTYLNSHGRRYAFLGKFIGTTIEYAILWYNFTDYDSRVPTPFGYTDLLNVECLREVIV